jgi:hypothetical protein
MKKSLLVLLTLGVLISCKKDTGSVSSATNEQDVLVFGHFYGECFGESCIETFKLTNTKLYEDTMDDYTGQQLAFIELTNEKFEAVKNLIDYFPSQLLSETKTVIGCPDCADGGGLFIQHYGNSIVKSWRIDQDKDNVPAYLHTFVDSVNKKIEFLSK